MKTLLVSFFTACFLLTVPFLATAQQTKTGKLKVTKKKPGANGVIYRDSLFQKKNLGTQQPGTTQGINGQRMNRGGKVPQGSIYRDSLPYVKSPGAQQPGTVQGVNGQRDSLPYVKGPGANQPGQVRGNRAGRSGQTVSGTTTNGQHVTVPGLGKKQGRVQNNQQAAGQRKAKVKRNPQNTGQKKKMQQKRKKNN